MKKYIQKIINLFRSLLEGVLRFPAETFIGLTFFALWILRDRNVSLFGNELNVLLLFLPLYVINFTLHRLLKGRAALILYWLSAFLWVPLQIFMGKEYLWQVGVANILAVLVLTLGVERMNKRAFSANLLHTFVKMFKAGVICGLMVLLLELILLSANLLFDLGLNDRWFGYPCVFIAFVIFPLLCCIGVSEPYEEKKHSFLHTCIDYILSPALLIYAVILYLYIIRIAVRWELPDGSVAYLVLLFISVALLSRLAQYIIENRHFDLFYHWLPLIALAPLVLLWLGIARRVGEYGLTEWRFALIVLASLMSLFMLMLNFKRTRDFQMMTALLALTFILFSYVPGITAQDFGIRSQKARLKAYMPAMLAGSLDEKTLAKAEGALVYLKNKMDTSAFNADFAALSLYENKKYEDDVLSAIYNCEARIDIGEYTELLPESAYYDSNDGTRWSFYDRDTDALLLSVDIGPKLDSLSADESLLRNPSIWTAENENYKVVFRTLSKSAYRSSYFSLFRKPE